VELNAALFWMRWEDIQLYVFGLSSAANYYVENAGKAESRGAEVALRFLPASGWDVFSSFGLLDTQFLSGSKAQGADVGGNRLPLAPRYSGNTGIQYSRLFSHNIRGYARCAFSFYGPFKYDASNKRGQSAYGIADVRAGLVTKQLFAELWFKNLLDKHYVPIAFPYPVLTRSGYLGECGPPRTFGIRIGFSL